MRHGHKLKLKKKKKKASDIQLRHFLHKIFAAFNLCSSSGLETKMLPLM